MTGINKQIQTKAWVHYVASYVALYEPGGVLLEDCNGEPLPGDTTKTRLLEKATGVYAQYWSRFRTGKRENVGVSILKRVEQKIPGSKDVYDTGPDRAPLWSALWSVDEQELWGVVKSISDKIRFYKACVSKGECICDYTSVESTGVYFAALSDYYQAKVRSSMGLRPLENMAELYYGVAFPSSWRMEMEDLAVLIAAFRLGQFRREAANYQETLGRCIEQSITEGSYITIILRYYGLLGYIYDYVDKLIPHSDKSIREIPQISRQSVIDNYGYRRLTQSEIEAQKLTIESDWARLHL